MATTFVTGFGRGLFTTRAALHPRFTRALQQTGSPVRAQFKLFGASESGAQQAVKEPKALEREHRGPRRAI